MKSKKALILVLISIFLVSASLYFFRFHDPLIAQRLDVEWLENTFPEKLDEDTLLPYGYTFGVWPKEFQGNPIVTKLTYQKGPPIKFIQEMTEVWKPVEVELTLTGPKTITPRLTASGWKECFESPYTCIQNKQNYIDSIFPDRKLHERDRVTLTWFDSQDPLAARGTHLLIQAKTYRIDRYTVITPEGVTQSFSLKAVNTPVGEDARVLFLKTMAGLKVKDDLSSARAWIQDKIKSVNLKEVQQIQDPRLRFSRLIQIQNWIYSLLSVDPTQVSPFFHLAGVTHILAMELLKTDRQYYEGQEAWIVSFKPLFETLLSYSKDFKDSKTETENIEALLQDILYQQSKMSH